MLDTVYRSRTDGWPGVRTETGERGPAPRVAARPHGRARPRGAPGLDQPGVGARARAAVVRAERDLLPRAAAPRRPRARAGRAGRARGRADGAPGARGAPAHRFRPGHLGAVQRGV